MTKTDPTVEAADSPAPSETHWRAYPSAASERRWPWRLTPLPPRRLTGSRRRQAHRRLTPSSAALPPQGGAPASVILVRGSAHCLVGADAIGERLPSRQTIPRPLGITTGRFGPFHSLGERRGLPSAKWGGAQSRKLNSVRRVCERPSAPLVCDGHNFLPAAPIALSTIPISSSAMFVDP
jgi:hypothetical protein